MYKLFMDEEETLEFSGTPVDVDNTPISITLNGENIAPYDPLYVTFNPKADDKELAVINSSNEFSFKLN